MKKILIATDGSEGALKAADFVGEQFAGMEDLQITLFHVSSGVPPELWDDGHILTEEEKTERKAVLDEWFRNQKLKLDLIFRPAMEKLVSRGISPNQIETRPVSESVKNTPECILAEAKSGGYSTLVVGRCGASATAHALLGSTVGKVIDRGRGIAVCVVE
ncbi:MAG: universal stress protein [Thermodesulfobacteriota bacterium]